MRISDWSSDVCSSDLEIRGWLIAQSFPASAECLKDRGHAQCPGPRGFACKSHQHPGTQAPLIVKRSIHVENDQIYIVPIHRVPDHWHHWFRSEEHTSELQSLMRISYAVFCLKKKIKQAKTKN